MLRILRDSWLLGPAALFISLIAATGASAVGITQTGFLTPHNGLTYVVRHDGYANTGEYLYEVDINGQPRAGDYVTFTYNYRWPGAQIERAIGAQNHPQFRLKFNQTVPISVQACRKRPPRSSVCTPWGSFVLEGPRRR